MHASKRLSGWIFVVLSALFISGCHPIYYASNGHNVPLLKEKHEVRVNAGVTLTEYLAGPDLQMAYAASENIGIIANGIYLSSGDNSDGYGYLAEAGGGYFKALNKWWVAEVYAGTGFARVVNKDYYETHTLKFIKPFIQPAVGFSSDYFDLAFSPKIAWVHYNEPFILDFELRTDSNGNVIVGPDGYAEINVLKEKQTFFAFEPGFTMRGGWKYIKVQLQVVKSLQDIPDGDNLSINLSLSANLASRFRKVAR